MFKLENLSTLLSFAATILILFVVAYVFEKLAAGKNEKKEKVFTAFLLSWVSMRQQNKNKKDDDNGAAAQAANMGKGMMYIMPIMSVVFCWQYDSTFSVYWIISNIIAVVINVILNKKLPAIVERDKQRREAKLIKESK